VDLYRTVADLAGLQPGAEIEGETLRAMLDDPGATVKPHAFTQVGDGYAVRTARWRYVEWSGGEAGRQLYDMEGDPDETRNLVSDPRRAPVLAELRQALSAYRADRPTP
jgi:arylsulfatase A-like enzyme